MRFLSYTQLGWLNLICGVRPRVAQHFSVVDPIQFAASWTEFAAFFSHSHVSAPSTPQPLPCMILSSHSAHTEILGIRRANMKFPIPLQDPCNAASTSCSRLVISGVSLAYLVWSQSDRQRQHPVFLGLGCSWSWEEFVLWWGVSCEYHISVVSAAR